MTDLPDGWRRVPLEEVAEITMGQSPPGSSYNKSGEGVPFFQGKAEFTELFPEVRQFTTAGTKFATADDILLSVRAPVGPTNLAPTRCALGRGLAGIRAKAGVHQKYLLWALRASETELAAHGAGSTFAAITGKQLRSHQIALAPLDEQRRIVDNLEYHLSRLDAAERSLGTARARLEALHAATIEQCVVQARSHPGTSIRALGSLGTVGTGATPLKSKRDYYLGGRIPWVTSGDLARGLISEPTHFITQVALDETPVKLWPAGTLLVAMYGEGKTRGTVAELGLESTTNQACAAIVLYDQTPTHRAWVRLVLDSKYEAMRRLASGGVQPNLNLGIVRALEIPVPEESLALKLMDRRSTQVEAESRLRDELKASVGRARALRAALLRDAFAGRLDGASSAAEPEKERSNG